MNEDSFKSRVLIRYAPPVRAGDRALDGAKMTYDGGRRALTVDPGDVLRPGRVVEILLLPGIVDSMASSSWPGPAARATHGRHRHAPLRGTHDEPARGAVSR